MRSEIIIKNMQIKSLEKAKKLAKSINEIEEECGIKEVKITIENTFVCPWIKLDELNSTEMEKLLQSILKKI